MANPQIGPFIVTGTNLQILEYTTSRITGCTRKLCTSCSSLTRVSTRCCLRLGWEATGKLVFLSTQFRINDGALYSTGNSGRSPPNADGQLVVPTRELSDEVLPIPCSLMATATLRRRGPQRWGVQQYDYMVRCTGIWFFTWLVDAKTATHVRLFEHSTNIWAPALWYTNTTINRQLAL